MAKKVDVGHDVYDKQTNLNIKKELKFWFFSFLKIQFFFYGFLIKKPLQKFITR